MTTKIKSAIHKVFIDGDVINVEGAIVFVLIAVPVILFVSLFGRF